jgi:amino acid adenylation domain-containing protein
MESLLLKLAKHNIDVKVEKGNLKLNIPNGFDAQDILGEIKFRKEELIAFITERVQLKNNYRLIEKAPVKEYYPLSSAQKRLYFLREFDPLSLAYNMPQALKLNGVVDKERLTLAFKKLIQRHESLRTYFEVINEEPVQKIAEQVDFEIDYMECNREDADEIIKNFVRLFDLKKPPLLRLSLIKVAPEEYFLMFDLHHIITDGVSEPLLVKDFMAFYNNETLPELRLQYKDYVEWHLSEVQQEYILKQRAFWLNEFKEQITTLELPIDYERPSVKGHDGSFVTFYISPDETNKLRSVGESEGSTMFMMLLSIFNVFLSKIANQDDIIIGTPTAGRQHADLENIIGMFVNTLAIRSNPKGSLSFREFLSVVKSKTLSCFENQAYQLETLIDELKIERDTSRNPLFEVMFSYENFEPSVLELPGLTYSAHSIGHSVAKFDLTLLVHEYEGRLFLNFGYATDVFKKETIEKFTVYFKKLVSSIISDTNKKIADLEMLPIDEKKKLLYEFNANQLPCPTHKTIVDLFEEQLLKTPDNTAVLWDKKRLTYTDLNEKVNQLANHLMENGVKAHMVVALKMERSLEMIIGLLAILKTGAAYLPIDPSLPGQRILQMLEDSKTMHLLTDEDEQNSYKQFVNVINVHHPEIERCNKNNVRVLINPADVAYVIYTSGSTGKPKGVMIMHSAVINLIASQAELFKITPEERILQFSTIGFDASVEQLWLALLTGAALVLVNKDVITDQGMFNEFLSENHITHLHATPSFLENITLDKHDELKRIISGGEECKVSLAKRLCKEYVFYNEYGPTETTVTATVKQVTEADTTAIKISIGKPIHNTQAYILGRYKELLPEGTRGELYIGGAGLAKGYLYDEALTQERFVSNPFINGEKIYHTGDIAGWMPDGTLEFFGRIDNQVKLRGFRIELGEIENHLVKYELIKEVVVVLLEQEQQLVAYYVSENEILTADLKHFLYGELPEYMVPSYFVHLQALPLTISGKLNKKALPVPQLSREPEYVAPSNEVEEKLAEIWAEVLKLEKGIIGTNRNFFELGGHSLRAMVLANKIFKELNVSIPLKEIFEKPTIRLQAEVVKINQWLNKNTQAETVEKTKVVI